MKTKCRLFLQLALLVGSTALAPASLPAADFVPLKIVKQVLPAFPYAITQMGVREGIVRVAFSVDAAGRLEDCLAVVYNEPEFAEATLRAMKHWSFQPARLDGEPVAVAASLTFEFRTEGITVVSLTASEHVMAIVYRLPSSGRAYRAYLARELDRAPVAIAAPSPLYPAELTGADRRTVVVEFYIDETGRPRLVAANAEADPRLAALAVSAMSEWRFEPALVKGHPVLVRAMQVFNFGPSGISANGTGN
jgi:TonB family protein